MPLCKNWQPTIQRARIGTPIPHDDRHRQKVNLGAWCQSASFLTMLS